jgi:hypothetical protein
LIFHRRCHQRGYVPKTDSCEGRLYPSYDFRGKPFIKCVLTLGTFLLFT